MRLSVGFGQAMRICETAAFLNRRCRSLPDFSAVCACPASQIFSEKPVALLPFRQFDDILLIGDV